VGYVTITSATPPSLGPGETFQLAVSVLSVASPGPGGIGQQALAGRTVTYQTSAAGVATVNSSGLVSYVGAGSATITVTCEGVSAGQAITCVTPQAAVNSVTVSPTTLLGSAGQQAQVAATPRDSGGSALVGRTVTWGTSNASVVTVGADSGTDAHTATVTYAGAGSATITATCETVDGTCAATVSAASIGPATPTLPTPLRTFYVDFDNGLDSNAGTQGSPYKTLSKVRTAAIAGDRFYLKGTFPSGDANRLGQVSNAGTAANPVQIVQWPNEIATLSGGGGVDGYPSIWGGVTMKYWVFKDLALAPPSNMRAFSGQQASFVTFINCTFASTGGPPGAVQLFNNPDFAFYDCTFTGTYGNLGANSGDVIFCQSGSHRLRLVRCNFDVTSYHVTITLGGFQNAADATSTDAWVVGCTIRNTVAGGININGKGDRALIEHNLLYDIATTSSVPSQTPIFVAAPDCIVRYNRAYNCGREFVKIQAYIFASFTQTPNRTHVHNNTAFDVKGMAFLLAVANNLDPNTQLVDVVVENNLVWKCGQSAVQTGIPGENFGFFSGVYYPAWINLFNTTTKYTAGTIGGCIFRNNALARSASNSDQYVLGVRLHDASNASYTMASFQSTFAGCANNKQRTDPVLVSEVTPDLGLQAGSPMIDAGYATAGVAYQGAAPDIGYLESNY